MLLGILSVIALSVGAVQSAMDLSENERLALEQQKPAIVQLAEPAQDKNFVDPDMGF
jgi:hypothetical protein